MLIKVIYQNKINQTIDIDFVECDFWGYEIDDRIHDNLYCRREGQTQPVAMYGNGVYIIKIEEVKEDYPTTEEDRRAIKRLIELNKLSKIMWTE